MFMRSFLGSSWLMSLPSMRTVPSVGVKRRLIILRVVVLPLPLVPTMTKNSPLLMVRLMCCKAGFLS